MMHRLLPVQSIWQIFLKRPQPFVRSRKKVSNWLMGETLRLLKEHEKEPEDIAFSAENLAKLIELVDGGVINGNVAKEVFEQIFARNIDPEKICGRKRLKDRK